MKLKMASVLTSLVILSGISANESEAKSNLLQEPNIQISKSEKKKIEPSSYLQGRIDKNDKRYAPFLKALTLLEERGAKIIVETGTSRFGNGGFIGDGGSTIIFSDWASQNKAEVHSVDINPHHIEEAKKAAQDYSKNLSLVCSDSIEFLNEFSTPIDFLYLDSYEFDLNSPMPSQEHHLNELVAAYPCLHDQSIVMIDDCDLPQGGMGKRVIDHLTESGWTIVHRGYQVILSRD